MKRPYIFSFKDGRLVYFCGSRYIINLLGMYVETSLLNVYHQDPKLARNLVKIVYATIKKHNDLLQFSNI